MPQLETVPVIFRAERSGRFKGDITAVFPTIEASPGDWCACYEHIGQHSGCSREWYYATRPATPAEYADLLAELRDIYETGEDAVRLQIRKRV